MQRNYLTTTIKRLFMLSGHYCCAPGCTNAIYARVGDEDVLIGEIAHIEGSSDEGPRPNPALSRADRDGYDNLILLCPTHHSLVDKADSEFSVETLRRWKSDAVRATRERLAAGSSEVTFAELEMICDAFSQVNLGTPSTPMTAPNIDAKMAANGLTAEVGFMMTVGLGQAGMVADLIGRLAQISGRYPERLRAGFLARYEEALDSGLTGDDVFVYLVDSASDAVVSPQSDRQQIWIAQSAALAVVCHLFELCDLFEAPA